MENTPISPTISDPAPTLSVSVSERVALLDVLRGFALLGVLTANMATYSGYFFLSERQQAAFPSAQADGVITFLLHFLVDGKFYSLFSLLFGIGFGIQLNRAAEWIRPFAGHYRRRLSILFLIGLLHAVFLYTGDILTVYAMLGFVLLLFRRVSDRALLRWVIVFLCLPVIQYAGMLVYASMQSAAFTAAATVDTAREAMFDRMLETYRTGSYGGIVLNNMGGLIFGRYPDLLFTGRFFRVLAMFLLGYYISRRQLFNQVATHQRLIRQTISWGFDIGIPANLALALFMETNWYYGLQPAGILQPILYAIGVPALCLGYAALITYLFQRDTWRFRLSVFAPVGRMALTNYLMQSVLCGFIFLSYGLQLLTKIGPTISLLIGLGLFAFQVLFSRWWLARYQFGPMEWLWRSLTYGRRPAMAYPKPIRE